MNEPEALAGLAEAALDAAADATEAEVVVTRTSEALTRFADSQVHQSVDTECLGVSVRAVLGDGRAGVAAIDSDDPADAAVASRRAIALARLAPADPDFAGVAPAADAGAGWCDADTAQTTPEGRAALAREVFAEVGSLSAAGSVTTVLTERCVRTSEGADLYGASTGAQLLLVLAGPASTGHAEAGSHAIAELDAAATAHRAVAKVKAGADPGAIEAGDWPVVLEPSAVASLVQYLGYLGFNAKAVDEGRCFSSGRFGERLFDERLTLVDDALDPLARGLPFDDEGTPKQRVHMVRDGVLANAVHDRRSAARAQTASTGHALSAPNPLGPVPLDPFVVPGDGGSVDDMVKRTERGLLVTRFHYVNVVHPKEAVLTGMTRDGTFLVEDGEVARPVRNLRFTQSLVEALAEVTAVGSEPGYGTELLCGGIRVPALALPRFQFTGLTDFG